MKMFVFHAPDGNIMIFYLFNVLHEHSHWKKTLGKNPPEKNLKNLDPSRILVPSMRWGYGKYLSIFRRPNINRRRLEENFFSFAMFQKTLQKF